MFQLLNAFNQIENFYPLVTYFELALHYKYDDDEADSTEHHSQQQLGRGQTTHPVAKMWRINYLPRRPKKAQRDKNIFFQFLD